MRNGREASWVLECSVTRALSCRLRFRFPSYRAAMTLKLHTVQVPTTTMALS